MNSRPKVTRRQVLKGAAAVATVSAFPKVAFASSENFTFTLPTGSSIPLSPNFLGLSVDKSALNETFHNTSGDVVPYLSADNYALVEMYQLLLRNGCVPVLRIGADGVDRYNYNGLGHSTGNGMVTTPTSITELAGFIQATGWKCLYGVNMANAFNNGSGWVGGGEDTAAAVSEVTAVVDAFGALGISGQLLGIEIGNEPDDYATNEVDGGAGGGYFGSTWGPPYTQVISRWTDYYNAISTASYGSYPTPAITATAAGGSAHKSALNQDFVNNFGSGLTGKINLLTQHFYIGDGASQSVTDLVSTESWTQYFNAEFSNSSGGLGYMANNLPGGHTIQWRISETNTYYGSDVPAGVTYSFASALWTLDLCIYLAQLGCQGINLFGGGGGLSYEPIQDSNGFIEQAMPNYYALMLFCMAGQGNVMNFTQPNTGLNVSFYVVENSSTQYSVIINNKDTTDMNLTIDLPSTVSSAGYYDLTATGGLAMAADMAKDVVAKISGAYITANPNPPTTYLTYPTPSLNGAIGYPTSTSVSTTVYAATARLVVIKLVA